MIRPSTRSRYADAELLASAIENVVRNALRYSPPNSSVEIAPHSNQIGGGSGWSAITDPGSGRGFATHLRAILPGR